LQAEEADAEVVADCDAARDVDCLAEDGLEEDAEALELFADGARERVHRGGGPRTRQVGLDEPQERETAQW
jgi:hypothetical protein